MSDKKPVPLDPKRGKKKQRPPIPKGQKAPVTQFPKGGKRKQPASRVELEYMSDASAAMLLKSPSGGRLLVVLSFLAIAIAILWACWAEVDEITRGDGKVVPSSRLQVVQNLEGGILEKLLVREGQLVEKGQALMQLDDTSFNSTFQESEVEYFSVLATIARLKAEVDERRLIFPDEVKSYTDLISRERDVYNSRREGLEAELDIVKEKVRQSEQEMRAMETRRDHLQRSYDLGLKELEMTRPLALKGVVSEVEMIQLEQRVNDLLSELNEAELSLPRLQSTLQEQRGREREVKLKFREETLEELRAEEVKLAQLTQSRKSLVDQVSRREVRAPLPGIVKKIHVNTIGGVVQPGMDLIEIVPVEDALLVEAKINPKDVAFLQTGDKAIVKLTAYDFSIYGGLEGKVDHISADTITDEQGESYYIVRIRTEKSHLGTDKEPLEIIPGMHAQVDIVTGKKTIMSYLLKPVLKARANALTER
ncbi:HlyD family type I secretion periplasmic adaptor subunit [Sansalvadorimonas sp. 2012CJ34-2]|uniref:Membrane fusion protein (MFP) family protein n=1 Tax=Parendozoicomonas callyspongiae TaxID=2942213 RepID=A0ABT0PAG5_9GAMM|nr:HlyD family type I secretion periplasmic adaptor subunit [Sansalvadorimonas sp. 2012CJ34-2]MCL6268389.1 HlyD family type I secretion periplasmic adaptor subunit [Sansalvadorimonas sp. 2012CJ34-2]